MKINLPTTFFLLNCLYNSQYLFASTPKCIAHRGFHYDSLENSSQSIEKAAKSNVDGIEFDVRHTKDGIGLLVHNKTLRHIAKSKPYKQCPKDPIAFLNYDDIESSCLLKNGASIITLEDSYKLLKDKKITVFVELKDLPSMRTLRSLRGFERNNKIDLRVISFKENALKRIRQSKATKNIKTLLLSVTTPEATSHSGVSSHFYNKEQINSLRNNNKELSLWTLNDNSEFALAQASGADYITTDRPIECKRYFHAKIAENEDK